MPSEGYRALRRAFEAQASTPLPPTVAGIRAAVAAFDGLFPLAADVRVERVDAAGVPGEWIVCGDAHDERVILYAHGGCYISGSTATVRECCSRIARASRARVLSLDYRLAPEHPLPAALDDVVTAYDWLQSAGHAAHRIAFAGDSAGGALVIAALMKIRDEAGLALPAAAVTLSPWVDLALEHETLRRNAGRDIASLVPMEVGAAAYVGTDDRRQPAASPLFGDFSGLPPLLVQVGGGELLLDDSLALAHRARRAGVDVTLDVWPEMFHSWHWFASQLDEAVEAIGAVGAFVRRHTAQA